MFPTYHFNETALMLIYLTIALLIPAAAIYFDNAQWPHKH
jgi:hypothetical protein